jgi:hypothetical protein
MEFGTLRKDMKMLELQKAIDQTYLILMEHHSCQDSCKTLGTSNEYDHLRGLAVIIGYYMLGLSNG